MARKAKKVLAAPEPAPKPLPAADPTWQPERMTEARLAALKADGFLLPEQWPGSARLALVSGKHGWTLLQHGSLDPAHPNFHNGAAHFPPPTYRAPDGTRFVAASNGARVALVGLFKRSGPTCLRVLPDTPTPPWLETDMSDEKAARPETVKGQTKIGVPKFDYATMTDTELCAWIAEREGWWMARAYQIEKQGVTGFRARCRAALDAGRPKAEPEPKAKANGNGKLVNKPVAKAVKAKANGKTNGKAKAPAPKVRAYPKAEQIRRKGTGKRKAKASR